MPLSPVAFVLFSLSENFMLICYLKVRRLMAAATHRSTVAHPPVRRTKRYALYTNSQPVCLPLLFFIFSKTKKAVLLSAVGVMDVMVLTDLVDAFNRVSVGLVMWLVSLKTLFFFSISRVRVITHESNSMARIQGSSLRTPSFRT